VERERLSPSQAATVPAPEPVRGCAEYSWRLRPEAGVVYMLERSGWVAAATWPVASAAVTDPWPAGRATPVRMTRMTVLSKRWRCRDAEAALEALNLADGPLDVDSGIR